MSQTIEAAYHAKGFGRRIGFGQSPALILVDFLEGYFDPKSPLFIGDDSPLRSALRLREAAHQAGIPVIVTKMGLAKLDPVAHIMSRKSNLVDFVRSGALTRLAGPLIPDTNDIVISKEQASAFFGTSLASILTAMRVDSLILTGLSTSGCVRATCVDTISHGFVAIVVEDAVGDIDPAPHRGSLFDMGQKYADIVSELEVLEHFETFRHS